jgi:hypothetical protein
MLLLDLVDHLEQLQDAKHNIVDVAEPRRLCLFGVVHAACMNLQNGC